MNVSLQSVQPAIILCSFVDALVYCPVNSMFLRVNLPWPHPVELVAELDPLSVAIPQPVCHRRFERTVIPKLIVIKISRKFFCHIPVLFKNLITQWFCCFPESFVLIVQFLRRYLQHLIKKLNLLIDAKCRMNWLRRLSL